MPNNSYWVTIHCLLADIGHIIILPILPILLVLVLVIHVILFLVCLHHWVFVLRLLL
jgi:hypothetical protein